MFVKMFEKSLKIAMCDGSLSVNW